MRLLCGQTECKWSGLTFFSYGFADNVWNFKYLYLSLRYINRVMNRIITAILLLIMALGIQAQQKQISYIKNDGAWYQVYDEKGKKITTMSKSSVGEVVGWGVDFFVSLDGAWYKIYDANGNKINTLSKASVGKVVSVSGSTFTSENGGFLYLFDKKGKKINTMSK